MKIGLYFGTFNPIHVGHLTIANHLAEHSDLDQIWFVVTPLSPFKKKSSLLDDYQRLEMVYRATKDYTKLKPSDIEFNLPQPNYTVNTLAYLQEKYPDLALGIGSITDGSSASLYIQLGADFIVTPVFREDIAIVCNRRKIPFFPGCGSLTEIAKAEEMGCEVVKLFPGSIYGSEFIKAIKGPQPWTCIMPTGGVEPTEESLKDWFNAGAFCVGIGSKLMIKDSTGSYNYTEIEKLVKICTSFIKELKVK